MAREITLDGVKYREVVQDYAPHLSKSKFAIVSNSDGAIWVTYEESIIVAFHNDGSLHRCILNGKDKQTFKADSYNRILDSSKD